MTRLRPIRTGDVALAPGYLFRPEASNPLEALGLGVPADRKLRCPIGAFLVEHPQRGPILIDTGMHPVVATDAKRNLGRLGAALARGLRVPPEENVPARLRGWGIEPGEIELVVMTHLHPDHTSAMSEFPSATFLVTEAEWRAATGRRAVLGGYLSSHLPPRERVRFVDFGSGQARDGLSRTVDLLGDGSLVLVSTPGHTVGHLSVLVDARDFVLGDAVYTLRNLHEDLLPWRTADDQASLETMRELRAFAARHPDVALIPTHDPGVWEAFR